MSAALAWTLVHFLWQGAAIAGALEVALVALRGRSSDARYLARLVALAALALAPAVTFALLLRGGGGPALELELEGLAALVGSAPARAELPPWIVPLWAAGSAFFGLRLVAGWWRVRRLTRAGVGRGLPLPWSARFEALREALGVRAVARVVESAALAAPAVVGWLRPVVLVPARVLTGLSEEQVLALLAHELAHVQRLDYLVNLVQSALEALLFYHPAVWWISAGLRAEREYCCDDVAVALGADGLAYARALTELEAWRGAELSIGVSTRGGSLMQRIQRLVSAPREDRARGAAHAFGVLLLAATTGGAALAVSGGERSGAQEPDGVDAFRAPRAEAAPEEGGAGVLEALAALGYVGDQDDEPAVEALAALGYVGGQEKKADLDATLERLGELFAGLEGLQDSKEVVSVIERAKGQDTPARTRTMTLAELFAAPRGDAAPAEKRLTTLADLFAARAAAQDEDPSGAAAKVLEALKKGDRVIAEDLRAALEALREAQVQGQTPALVDRAGRVDAGALKALQALLARVEPQEHAGDTLPEVARKALRDAARAGEPLRIRAEDATPLRHVDAIREQLEAFTRERADQDAEEKVKVEVGDTLPEVARRALGDARRWRELVEANPGLEPNRLKPGQELALPHDVEQALREAVHHAELARDAALRALQGVEGQERPEPFGVRFQQWQEALPDHGTWLKALEEQGAWEPDEAQLDAWKEMAGAWKTWQEHGGEVDRWVAHPGNVGEWAGVWEKAASAAVGDEAEDAAARTLRQHLKRILEGHDADLQEKLREALEQTGSAEGRTNSYRFGPVLFDFHGVAPEDHKAESQRWRLLLDSRHRGEQQKPKAAGKDEGTSQIWYP